MGSMYENSGRNRAGGLVESMERLIDVISENVVDYMAEMFFGRESLLDRQCGNVLFRLFEGMPKRDGMFVGIDLASREDTTSWIDMVESRKMEVCTFGGVPREKIF